MKTAIEVLTKYSDGDYTQFKGYENILLAMQEYAEQYHESRMKEIKKFKGRPNPEDVNPYDLATVKKNIATRKNK